MTCTGCGSDRFGRVCRTCVEEWEQGGSPAWAQRPPGVTVAVEAPTTPHFTPWLEHGHWDHRRRAA